MESYNGVLIPIFHQLASASSFTKQINFQPKANGKQIKTNKNENLRLRGDTKNKIIKSNPFEKVKKCLLKRVALSRV